MTLHAVCVAPSTGETPSRTRGPGHDKVRLDATVRRGERERVRDRRPVSRESARLDDTRPCVLPGNNNIHMQRIRYRQSATSWQTIYPFGSRLFVYTELEFVYSHKCSIYTQQHRHCSALKENKMDNIKNMCVNTSAINCRSNGPTN